MGDLETCQLVQKKGNRHVPCKEVRDMQYVVDDVSLVICHSHFKLEPPELDAICRFTISLLEKKEQKEQVKQQEREPVKPKQEAVTDGTLPGF